MPKKLAIGVVLAALIAAIAWKLHHHAGAHAPSATGAAHAAATAQPHRPRGPVATATLSGHVTRASDGAPIANATVALAPVDALFRLDRGDDSQLVATTDAAGAWTAPRVPPGTYIVTATAAGFAPVAHPRFAVAPGQDRRGIDFALSPGGTLVQGTVSDVGGGPIAGVRVIAVEASLESVTSPTPYIALTGGDGHYALPLPDGSFELAAIHDDYTRGEKPISVAGKPLTVDFSLVPGGVIHGQVIARDTGKPVAGAMVSGRAGRSAFGAGGSHAQADADGKFVLRRLGSGAVAIEAAGPGYATAQPTVVELGIGEEVAGVRVLVDHARSISGHVYAKGTKQGVAGVHVGAWSMSSQRQAMDPEPTGDDGAFEIIGVKPATYILGAIAQDKMPALGQSITVGDKDVTGVVIEVATGATLRGHVEPPGPADLGLALVGDVGLGNLIELFKTAMVKGHADAAGQFELQHVPPGTFDLVATTHDGPAGKLRVTVSDADQSGLVVQLEPRASIEGKVVDTKGAAVAGVSVSARRTGRQDVLFEMNMAMRGVTSGQDGTFRIVGLEPGTYQVISRDTDDMFARMGDKAKHPDDITLAAGQTRSGVVVTVPARDGVIRGVVLDTDGHATADTWVTAYPLPPKGVPAKMAEYMMYDGTQPVLSGADGKFEVDHLRDGDYRLVAEGPHGGSHGEEPSAKPGDSVTIHLASLGTLSGHVTRSGEPVTSYDLVCHGPSGRTDRQVDAPDGAYSLGHLAPGPYDCTASSDGGVVSGHVDVPGGAATLDLQLAPWATLTGTVVSVLDGQAVPGVVAIDQSAEGGRGFSAAVFAGGDSPQVSDPGGRFRIEQVAAGSGTVAFMPRTGGFEQLATKSYEVTAGQTQDLGTIKVVPPRTGDAGTLGLDTSADGGALTVTMVDASGPSAAAGIVVGDKITAIDGHVIGDLTAPIASKLLASGTLSVGQTVALTLARGVTVSVTAAKW